MTSLLEVSSIGIFQWLEYAFYDLATVIRMIIMKLFNRFGKAKEKWHKKALFLDLSKTRVVIVDRTETKPECIPSTIPQVEFQFVMEELLLNPEEYGLLGFFNS